MTFKRFAGLALIGLLHASAARSFGIDVCFNIPNPGSPTIVNCIGVGESCRTSQLTQREEVGCRAIASADSLSGLTGSTAIISGRSLVHTDSTYLMAQLIGFTPWQAYLIAIYDSATDQNQYTPFDQNGVQMLSNTAVADCRARWGLLMPARCLIASPVMSGVGKFDATDGGMLLHLHTRYAPVLDEEPPPIGFPADYFSVSNAPYEPVVNNLRAWVFGQRGDACVGGIVSRMPEGVATAPCDRRDRLLNSPQNFFAAGVTPLAVPFQSNLGILVINRGETRTILATNHDLQAYIEPQDVRFAKAGLFLHALGDRYSHHTCTDRSYFKRQDGGGYLSTYNSVACGQGSHFLWHAWEQGTLQSDDNLPSERQTMRPALAAVYGQLQAYGRLLQLPVSRNVNEAELLDRLIAVLQIYGPKERLDAMVALTEQYGALPLPGHGSAAALTIDQWLVAAQYRPSK
ncbi:MAG: hypothetical protein ACR2I8_08640 [Steroidobacteraceae bacterium]